DDIDTPRVLLERDAADAAHRVGHEQRRAVASDAAERGEIGDHAGRAFIVNGDDGAVIVLSQSRLDERGLNRLAPGHLDGIDDAAQPLGNRGEALAELAVASARVSGPKMLASAASIMPVPLAAKSRMGPAAPNTRRSIVWTSRRSA